MLSYFVLSEIISPQNLEKKLIQKWKVCGAWFLFHASYLNIACLSWTTAMGYRPEVCVTSQEVLFHLSQVPGILHSQFKLKCKDQGQKIFFFYTPALLDITQWRVMWKRKLVVDKGHEEYSVQNVSGALYN